MDGAEIEDAGFYRLMEREFTDQSTHGRNRSL